MRAKDTTIDPLKWEMTGKEYRLGDSVTVDMYNHGEVFEVVGIRESELELKGDWSGGTHNVSQSGWYPVKKCKLVLPDYGWTTIKEEDEKIRN
jgi:hypothetical protein